MKTLLLASALLLSSIPAQAILHLYTWEGTVDYGNGGSGTASGSFVYDDAAEVVFTHEDGQQILGNAISRTSFLLGGVTYGRTDLWEAHRSPADDFAFAELILDQGGMENGARLTWGSNRWGFSTWRADDSEWNETGGQIVSLERQSGWMPTLGDASPTPEPASIVLMGTALAGFGLFRQGLRRRRPRIDSHRA